MLHWTKNLVIAGIIVSGIARAAWGEGADNGYTISDDYLSQRQAAFTVDPDKMVFPNGSTNRVYGLVVETGYPEVIITLVSLADGTTSLYFCNGGSFTGLGHYSAIRRSTEALLAAAPEYLAQAAAVTSFPLPARGNTRFYFLTFDGTYSTEVDQDDLVNNRLPLSPLFLQAQEVIARLSQWDELSQDMLEYAARGEVSNILKMLELDPLLAEARDDTGLTPLMAAARAGQGEVLMALLDAKPEIDAQDNEGFTALMFAANSGQLVCVKLLLEAGAGVNEQAHDASTPLMFAAQFGHNDVVRLLLDNGADPNMVGSHGLTALGLARQNGLTETASILAGNEE